MTSLLSVEDLRVHLPQGDRMVAAVDGVSFDVQPGQVVGIAGESGSGKTMTALALLGLLPSGAKVSGRAMYGDIDLTTARPSEVRALRGTELAIVFQDPMTSLHPMLSVGRQLTEHLRHHERVSRRAARVRAIELLTELRIPNPGVALNSYPHQFSGGMRQRIAIAIAIACRPRLLIADEPTTALDVTIQAGIIRLLDWLRQESDLGIILITHDLGVLSSLADVMHVFYGGRIVESGSRALVLGAPRHPYTRGLLDALPRSGADQTAAALSPIPGTAPRLGEAPPGCAFHPRCKYVREMCRVESPRLAEVDDARHLACPVDPLAPSASTPKMEQA